MPLFPRLVRMNAGSYWAGRSRRLSTTELAGATTMARVVGTLQNDALYGPAEGSYIWGDSDGDLLNQVGGSDQIFGGAANDVIYGDSYRLLDHATGGNDIIRGGGGN